MHRLSRSWGFLDRLPRLGSSMSFRWLKPYMPGGLYGRAMLILLLPVVTVMLVVSVLFIQRHFEGVTQQMTRSVSREVQVMLDSGATAEQIAASPLAEALRIAVAPVPAQAVPE